jgi:hypothetical protein
MKQESQVKLSKSILFLLAVPLLLTDVAFAQVAISAATKVNQTLNGFLYVVMSIGIVLFTAALVLAGYKFAFVEGTKFADLKGVLIGGVLFGAAGAIAGFLVTGA